MPLPKGYTLDQPATTLPPGYTLDATPTSTTTGGPTPPVDMSNVAGAQGPLPTPAAHPAVNMQPSLLGRDPDPSPLANFAKGVVKSIPGTMSGVAKLLPGTSDATEPLDAAAQTHGTAQAIGKGIGNAAQFLIPGAAEEKIGLYGASKLPMLGEYAAPIAKLGAQALGSGTVNAAQGGSFGAGAAAGAAGGLFGMGMKAIAPKIAEGAMGIRGADRAYGRTPGEAILNETSGVNPGTIADQAGKKVGLYTSQLDDAAKASRTQVNLLPARDTAESWLKTAEKRGNPSTYKEVGQIGNQLNNGISGAPLPQFVSADKGLALRRGIDDLQTSWNPATVKDFSNRAVSATRNSLGDELEGAIPQYRPLNSKISTLMPVAQRAAAKDLNAGFVQRSLGRFSAHTGALVGAGAGGAFGYKEGGIPGAIAGATLGVAGPEVVASPEFQMLAARGMFSPATSKIAIPAATGAALQSRGLYGNKR